MERHFPIAGEVAASRERLVHERDSYKARLETAERELAMLESKVQHLEKAAHEFRDSVLNERAHIAENGMTNDQINDVLNNFDEHFLYPFFYTPSSNI